MVEERIEDGVRIAELFASELSGRRDGALGALSVTDAVTDVEPTVDGARAYDITMETESSSDRIGRVFVHPDRAHVAVREGPDVAHDAATELDLRTRPKATQPPQTLVFLESGAAVKRGLGVLEAVVRSARGSE